MCKENCKCNEKFPFPIGKYEEYPVCVNHAVNVVEKLNNEIYDVNISYAEEAGCPFSLETDGLEMSIKFLDLPIWCSFEDTREWLTDDEIEPLEAFVRKAAKNAFENINNVIGRWVSKTKE